jgi:outer membrane protein insertion porin family
VLTALAIVALVAAQDAPQGAPAETPGSAGPAESLPDGTRAKDDVRVDQPADVAPKTVASVPFVVESVEFVNKTYFRDETLRSFMLHPIPGELDEATLEADAERIADKYRDRGFLKAHVSVKEVPSTPPRGVKAVFTIEAGDRAELKSVKIVGNALVPEAELKEGFFSRPPEPFGFLTRAGFFHRPYLDQDGQRLVANYYKRGFLEARVTDTWVAAAPSLDGLAVTMRVVEGPVYELAGIKFEGDLPKNADLNAMRAHIAIKDGDVCDLVSIQQQADSLLDPLREEGHPFARFEQSVAVAAPPSGNQAHRAVVLTMRFVAGPKPVVRDIKIAGNKGTQERVIRRDIAIKKGEAWDHKAAKKTEHDLMLTGFFAQVQVRAIPTEDANVVDAEVDVVEQQTYIISIAPAYDTTEGLIGVGILADRNFLGTGIYASAFARLSSLKQTFDLSVSEPRFLDTHIILGGGLHRREISYPAFRVLSQIGGDVHVSIPIADTGVYAGGGVGVEYGGVYLYDKAKGDAFTGPQLDLKNESDLLPSGVFRNPVSASVAFDRRDSILLPRNGVYAAATATYAGRFTLSQLDFVDTGFQFKAYWSPIFNITLKSNTDLGRIFNPTGGDVPVTDRYFLGGLGSVRGYPILSITPSRLLPVTVPLNADPHSQDLLESLCRSPANPNTCNVDVGGVARFVQNFEIEFPLWPDTPFRGFTFLDMGNSFDDADFARLLAGQPIARNSSRPNPLVPGSRPLPLNLYYSTGFGVLLETPVLPFRFEWSIPLTPRAGIDQPISFFLGVGSAF